MKISKSASRKNLLFFISPPNVCLLDPSLNPHRTSQHQFPNNAALSHPAFTCSNSTIDLLTKRICEILLKLSRTPLDTFHTLLIVLLLILKKLLPAAFGTFVAIEIYPQLVYSHRCDVCHLKNFFFLSKRTNLRGNRFRKQVKKNFQECIQEKIFKKISS